MKYILNEQGQPAPEADIRKWAAWYENAPRHVATSQVGRAWISTVFLALDHNFGRKGPPILWESMVFYPGPFDNDFRRCAGSREQAEAMHLEFVREITAKIPWWERMFFRIFHRFYPPKRPIVRLASVQVNK